MENPLEKKYFQILNDFIEPLKFDNNAVFDTYEDAENNLMLLDYIVYLYDPKIDIGKTLREHYLLVFKELAKIPYVFMQQNILLYMPGLQICDLDEDYQKFLVRKITSYRVHIAHSHLVQTNTETLLAFNRYLDE